MPGGYGNTAQGYYSFAAGRKAYAKYHGCFAWGDSTDDTVACKDADEFVARASGGFYFYTKADLSTGVWIGPGESDWHSLSDRAAKRDLEPVDPDEVLARLAELPIYTWRYAAQSNGGRHMGPMAQDFRAAFGLGTDDRSIGSLDADGVALAALQADLPAEDVLVMVKPSTLIARRRRMSERNVTWGSPRIRSGSSRRKSRRSRSRRTRRGRRPSRAPESKSRGLEAARLTMNGFQPILGGGGATMARASSQEAAELSGALKRLARGRPVFIRRKGRNAYVLLSAARYRRMLERLEDLEDAADADRAIREFEVSGEKPVPWEQVKRELGLG